MGERDEIGATRRRELVELLLETWNLIDLLLLLRYCLSSYLSFYFPVSYETTCCPLRPFSQWSCKMRVSMNYENSKVCNLRINKEKS